MEISNAARLQAIDVVQVSDNTFALECNNKLYYIGAVLFRIIQYVKAGQDFPEIQQRVRAEYQLTLTREKFDHILDDTLGKILTAAAPTEAAPGATPQAYVYGQVKLIGEQTLSRLTRGLDVLFRPAVALPLLLLALALTGLQFWRLHEAQLLTRTVSAEHGVAMILGGYLFFAVVGLFHELGHATAAARFGISPKEIGFGFYLVLPVLYTDVSRVWILPKPKRLLVNVAGIYFQLLVNILLFAAFEVAVRQGGTAQHLVVSFIITNATLAVYALNPFFRNDGYWIFSDLFTIPNLAGQSAGYLRKIWQFVRSRGEAPFRGAGLTGWSETALAVYAAGRLGLISWVSYLGYSGFYQSFQQTLDRIQHRGRFAHETFFESTFYLLKLGLFLVLFSVLMYRTLRPRVLQLLARLRGPQAEAPAAAVPQAA